jgi:hypothetical protein
MSATIVSSACASVRKHFCTGRIETTSPSQESLVARRRQCLRLTTFLTGKARAHGCPNDLWTMRRVADLVLPPMAFVVLLTHLLPLLGPIGVSGPCHPSHRRNQQDCQEWAQQSLPPDVKGPLFLTFVARMATERANIRRVVDTLATSWAQLDVHCHSTVSQPD